MTAKEKKIIQSTLKEILELLEVKSEFEIEEKDDLIDIKLTTEESGIIIGYHGDTLDALQLILSLAVAKKLDKFLRISIDVGDYKKNREDWLKNLALETKDRVLVEGKEIVLPQLKSWERRIIHLLLQNDDKVISQSQGEGRDRVLVVSPKP
ncbi:MAG: KH domain-containing protein [Candidatus Levybacteria bacterium]|nr:KH domain-containing protein [Candidatus Levybacteria bacterium]